MFPWHSPELCSQCDQMQTRGGDGLGINPCLCISLQAVSIDVSGAVLLPICPGSSPLEGQQRVKINSWRRQNRLQMCADEPGDLSPACDSNTSNCVLQCGVPLCPFISCFLNLELSLFFFLSAAGTSIVCYVALIQQSETCCGESSENLG